MPFHNVEPQAGQPGAGQSRRVALVIGNGRYAHATALANPADDARAMAELLARLGFEVVEGIDLSHRSIGDVQAAFEDKLRTNPDVALLFYAGHGLQVDGRNYLIPIDAEISKKAHLASRALSFNDVLEPMAQHASASLIFLDACRDNPFARNLLRAFEPGVPRQATDPLPSAGPIRGGLARIDKVAGTFIAYATAPDRVAYDGQGRNSPFTSGLLKHMPVVGLSIGDMMIDVRNAVLRETSGRQEPWDQSSLRSRFYFVPAATDTAQSSAPSSPGSFTRIQTLNVAAQEWPKLESSTDIARLNGFAKHFPGYFGDLALARVAQLERQEAERVLAAERARLEQEREAEQARLEKKAQQYEAAWQSAKAANTVATYEKFLGKWPSGPHTDAARQTIAGLEDQARAKHQSNQQYEAAWQSAKAANTIAAYEKFRAAWPRRQNSAAAMRIAALKEQDARARADEERQAAERARERAERERLARASAASSEAQRATAAQRTTASEKQRAYEQWLSQQKPEAVKAEREADEKMKARSLGGVHAEGLFSLIWAPILGAFAGPFFLGIILVIPVTIIAFLSGTSFRNAETIFGVHTLTYLSVIGAVLGVLFSIHGYRDNVKRWRRLHSQPK